MSDASSMGAAASLDLRDLHAANIARQAEWCPDQVPDLSFRGNELAGETGEACNVIKKLERERQGWSGSRATKDDLAQELADVVICADLCAVIAGIDLAAAVTEKFNATSEKQGLATKLAAPSHDLGAAASASASEMAPDHEFKSHPSVFHPAARGEKTFEYRRDDRGGYAVGQTVRLRCYAPETGYTSDPPLDRRITNILRGGEFELPQGYCILSLAPLAPLAAPETRARRRVAVAGSKPPADLKSPVLEAAMVGANGVVIASDWAEADDAQPLAPVDGDAARFDARVSAALAAWQEAQRTATVDEDQLDTDYGAMMCALAAADAVSSPAPAPDSGRGTAAPWRKVLSDLLAEHAKHICLHEETHRGGAIWTICDHCGRKWADDEGGFTPYEEPRPVTAAWALLICEEIDGRREPWTLS